MHKCLLLACGKHDISHFHSYTAKDPLCLENGATHIELVFLTYVNFYPTGPWAQFSIDNPLLRLFQSDLSCVTLTVKDNHCIECDKSRIMSYLPILETENYKKNK